MVLSHVLTFRVWQYWFTAWFKHTLHVLRPVLSVLFYHFLHSYSSCILFLHFQVLTLTRPSGTVNQRLPCLKMSPLFSCLSMPCSNCSRLMLSLTLARMSSYCKLSLQLIHYFSSERLQFSYSHLYRYCQCCYSFSVCVFMSDLHKPVRRKPGTGNWWFFSLLQLLKS